MYQKYTKPVSLNLRPCIIHSARETERRAHPYRVGRHLNRKSARSMHRNHRKVVSTKRIRAQRRCSTYREKFDGAGYWGTGKFALSLSLFYTANSFPLRGPPLDAPRLKENFAGIRALFLRRRHNRRGDVDNSVLQSRTRIYERIVCGLSSRSLLPEIASFLRDLYVSRERDKFGYWVEKSSVFQI